MAKIQGTNVAAPIAPFTTDDQFPTHDAIYGKGGQREVATIAERDAIPSARLTEGCTCYVAATEKTYRWKSNAWVEDTPEIASDASDISYTPSGSGSTPTTVAGALDSLNGSVSGLEGSVQDNADDIDDLQEGAVSVDVDTTTKVFAIKNSKGQDVGTITVSETTGLPATLTLAKAGTNGQSITVSLPTLAYNSQTQMLEYVDVIGTHVPTIKLSNLQIKYVGSTDPSTGTWALGDLILVGSNSSYELKVYDGNSTWQSVGSINNVSLDAKDIDFTTSNSGLTSTKVDKALDELNLIADGAPTSDLDIVDDNGCVLESLGDGHVKTKNFDSRDVGKIKQNVGLSEYDEFDETVAYDVGDVVLYDGLLYKFTTAHVAGAWTGSDVVETTITEGMEHPVATADTNEADLEFSDNDGNSVVRFGDGHIQTKNFDSSTLDNKIAKAAQPFSLVYNKSNPYGLLMYKDAAKRMLPNNVIPLIVIAGQSNADGRAPYTTAPNWLVNNNYSVNDYLMWNDTLQSFATYNVMTNNGAGTDNGSDGSGVDKFSFDPFFAKLFVEEYGTPLYAVRVALGGIGIGEATRRPATTGPKYSWNARIGCFGNDVNYLVLDIIDKVKNIKTWCKNNDKILLPIAILWHQGEHDAANSLKAAYKNGLCETISFIRGIFQEYTLPFICGYINENYTGANVDYPYINGVFEQVSEIDAYMKVVDMAGHYTSIGDNQHYDAAALSYMGAEMFNYYVGLNTYPQS